MESMEEMWPTAADGANVTKVPQAAALPKVLNRPLVEKGERKPLGSCL